jgi:hypothetical protein
MRGSLGLIKGLVFGLILTGSFGCTHPAVAPATSVSIPRLTSAYSLADVRALFEIGCFDLAEKAAREVQEADPESQGAAYYLELIHEARVETAKRRHGSGKWFPTYPPKAVP